MVCIRGGGDVRELDRVDRRQRQMGIRDGAEVEIVGAGESVGVLLFHTLRIK